MCINRVHLLQAQCRVTCIGVGCAECVKDVKYGQGVVIPLESSADPLREFEATDVKQNIFRFLIFIMWLKHQPQAYEWFLTIREHHPDLIKACRLKLAML